MGIYPTLQSQLDITLPHILLSQAVRISKLSSIEICDCGPQLLLPSILYSLVTLCRHNSSWGRQNLLFVNLDRQLTNTRYAKQSDKFICNPISRHTHHKHRYCSLSIIGNLVTSCFENGEIGLFRNFILHPPTKTTLVLQWQNEESSIKMAINLIGV